MARSPQAVIVKWVGETRFKQRSIRHNRELAEKADMWKTRLFVIPRATKRSATRWTAGCNESLTRPAKQASILRGVVGAMRTGVSSCTIRWRTERPQPHPPKRRGAFCCWDRRDRSPGAIGATRHRSDRRCASTRIAHCAMAEGGELGGTRHHPPGTAAQRAPQVSGLTHARIQLQDARRLILPQIRVSSWPVFAS
jgi:hypothetical protein